MSAHLWIERGHLRTANIPLRAKVAQRVWLLLHWRIRMLSVHRLALTRVRLRERVVDLNLVLQWFPRSHLEFEQGDANIMQRYMSPQILFFLFSPAFQIQQESIQFFEGRL